MTYMHKVTLSCKCVQKTGKLQNQSSHQYLFKSMTRLFAIVGASFSSKKQTIPHSRRYTSHTTMVGIMISYWLSQILFLCEYIFFLCEQFSFEYYPPGDRSSRHECRRDHRYATSPTHFNGAIALRIFVPAKSA